MLIPMKCPLKTLFQDTVLPPPRFSDLSTALGGASVVDIPAPPENQMISYLIVSSLLSKAANLIVIWTRNALQVRTTYSAIIVVWHFTNLSHSHSYLRTEVRGDFNIHGNKYF